MNIDLDEAYRRLGLKPLDEFITEQVASGHRDRRLGATTWMLVSAALRLHEVKDVMLVGRTISNADAMAEDCLHKFNTLNSARTYMHRKDFRRWNLGNGATLYWEGEQTFAKKVGLPNVEVFRDGLWAIKAIDRTKSPFARIRRIERTPDDRYLAYDESGIFLLELDEEGARDMASRDAFRIEREGW